MVDFLQLCIAPINIVFTILLGGVFFYWTMFLVGAVGLDLFDVDMDVDGDLDLHVDVDVDIDANVDLDGDVGLDAGHADFHADHDVDVGEATAEGGTHAGAGYSSWFISVLRFFNVGDVPMMILLSAAVGSLWAVSILTSHYFNPEQSFGRAVLWFVPNLLVSLFMAKILTTPFRYVFGQANLGIAAPTKIVGKTCVITTSEVTPRFGQAEIEQEGAPITLNVRCTEDVKLSKGDEAIITEHDKETDTYSVYPFDLEVKS